MFVFLSCAALMALMAQGAYLTTALVLISRIDIRDRIIPDVLVVALAVGGGVSLLSEALRQNDAVEWLPRAGGAAGAMALLTLVMAIFRRRRGRDGLGWGDVKMVGAGALWVDPVYLGPWFLLATLSAFAALAVMAWRGARITRRTSLPFGPHLAFGLWVVWLAQVAQF